MKTTKQIELSVDSFENDAIDINIGSLGYIAIRKIEDRITITVFSEKDKENPEAIDDIILDIDEDFT